MRSLHGGRPQQRLARGGGVKRVSAVKTMAHSSLGPERRCEVCDGEGELLCCDFCPRAYHLECTGLPQVPGDDQWRCPACERSSAAGAAPPGAAAEGAAAAAEARAEEEEAEDGQGEQRGGAPASSPGAPAGSPRKGQAGLPTRRVGVKGRRGGDGAASAGGVSSLMRSAAGEDDDDDVGADDAGEEEDAADEEEGAEELLPGIIDTDD